MLKGFLKVRTRQPTPRGRSVPSGLWVQQRNQELCRNTPHGFLGRCPGLDKLLHHELLQLSSARHGAQGQCGGLKARTAILGRNRGMGRVTSSQLRSVTPSPASFFYLAAHTAMADRTTQQRESRFGSRTSGTLRPGFRLLLRYSHKQGPRLGF